MNIHREQIKTSFVEGLRKGLNSFVWMMKILVPISLLTAILDWSGWIGYLDSVIQPVMGFLYLPPAAALPLLIAILTGNYGGIAAMAVLPFTLEQMTLIAIFQLICHNLVQETVIQGQSGISPLKAASFRFAAACATVVIVAQFMDLSCPTQFTCMAPVSDNLSFLQMLKEWFLTTSYLSVKIFFIIMSLLTAMEVLKNLGWIDRIVNFCAPGFKIFGLNSKGGIIWITALLFGLAYGAAIIVEEIRKGDLNSEELERLHLSIGINHAVIEDPSLYLALGIGALWLWIPRLVAAIVAVQLLILWQTLRRRSRLFAR